MRVVMAALVLAGGCASGSGAYDPTSGASPTSTPVVGAGAVGAGRMRVGGGKAQHVDSLTFPIDRVWRVLPAAYDSLVIPLTVLDARQRLAGNEGFKPQKRLGKVALTKYMDCGRGPGGETADTYDIFMSVVTKLRAAADGSTELVTTVNAAFRPQTVAQDYTPCNSTGLIEERVAALVKAALAR